MGPVVGDDAAHAHLRSTLQQALGDQRVSLSNANQRSGHSEDAVVDAGNDLADTGLDASLVAQIGDVLAGLANDDTRLFGRDDRTKSQHCLSVLLFGLGSGVHGLVLADGVVVGGIDHGLISDSGLVNFGSLHFVGGRLLGMRGKCGVK